MLYTIFLWMLVYYQICIPEFSRLAEISSFLLWEKFPFEWKEKQEITFNKLCKILMSVLLLNYLNFDKPFIQHTDVSLTAIGAKLS